MNFTRHLIAFFALLLPIAWVAVLGKKDDLTENILIGTGGFISSLFFYLWGLWDNKKTRTLILQRVKERLNGDMVLISHQERIHLGTLIKDFVIQPGRIANSTNNIEGLYLYKVTEKMKRRLETV